MIKRCFDATPFDGVEDVGGLWNGLLDSFLQSVSVTMLLELVGDVTYYREIGQEKGYFLCWKGVDDGWLWSRFDCF